MSSNPHGDWCLIESDPGVFTELIRGFGCTGLQVEELWSLDNLEAMKPVHGLIFLFKWVKTHGDDHEGSIVRDDRLEQIFFAKQVINNACATQAILSILLNTSHPDVQLGDTLTSFKDFSRQFDPTLKGLSISNSDPIKSVHNSFARQQMFEFDNSMMEEDKDAFHFVAYMPINGRLYELDGLQEGPIDLGACAADGWLGDVRPIIERRMQKYSGEEIHFNLMGVVSSRKDVLQKQLTQLETEQQVAVDTNDTQALAEFAQKAQTIQMGIHAEEEKMRAYRTENVRRRHNYLPFVVELLRILAKKGDLVALTEKAKEATKHRSDSKKAREKAMDVE